MTTQEILSLVDHTVLSPTATWEEVRAVCEEGVNYHTASVCIPAAFVAQAKEYLGDRLPICTVVGFPNGYSTTAAKVFETKEALQNGASEIDMVIPLGKLREGKYDEVLAEIKAIKAVCGEHILKVIVETCLLTEEEKIKMCEIVSQSGADYIKTSTGFSKGGATREDVALFAAHVAPHVKIKAAGGISTLQDAEDFIRLGALRLGSSRVISLVKQLQK